MYCKINFMQAFKVQMVAPTVKFEGWGGAYRGAV